MPRSEPIAMIISSDMPACTSSDILVLYQILRTSSFVSRSNRGSSNISVGPAIRSCRM